LYAFRLDFREAGRLVSGMSRGAKVTVAGGGALGLACALRLAWAGCRVTVADPAPERSASAVAAGMLAPAFEAALDAQAPPFEMMMASRDLWPELEARAGVPLDRSGALAAGSEAWLAGLRAAFVRFGLHAIDLPRRAAEDLAPGLSPSLDHALLAREDWRIDPSQGLAALRGACVAAGVAFETRRVEGRDDADWLVIAAGYAPDLAGLAPELSRLSPIKGQILRYDGVETGRLSVRGEGVYAVPGAAALAVGATMEAGLADTEPDPAKTAALAEGAADLLPALKGLSPRIAAGVRAATPDGLPLAGASTEAGVLLAAGARRNGWLLAPLVARTIAACVTGGDPGPYAAALDPRRFEGGR
jgi:glycine oxidase